MKVRYFAVAALAAVQILAGSYAVGGEGTVKGFVKDSQQAYVKGSDGECVRTVYESHEMPVECGYAKPAPMKEVARVEIVGNATAASVSAKVQEKVVIGANLLFPFDSAELSDDAKEIIDERINRLKGKMKLTSIVKVVGYADSTGPAEYNQVLSERRAKAVADYIVANAPRVTSNHIEVIGKGEADPVASNDTREGRAQNRRVVIFAEGVVEK